MKRLTAKELAEIVATSERKAEDIIARTAQLRAALAAEHDRFHDGCE